MVADMLMSQIVTAMTIINNGGPIITGSSESSLIMGQAARGDFSFWASMKRKVDWAFSSPSRIGGLIIFIIIATGGSSELVGP